MKRYRKPHSYKRKKSILKNRFFRLIILILILVSSFCWFLFFSRTFQVKKIIIIGEEKIAKEEIQKFFPKENIFLIDLDSIKENILNNFPQIAEIKVKRSFPDILSVSITERKAVAIWCQEGQCFLLDQEGIIFEPVFEKKSDYVTIEDKFNSKKLGDLALEKDKLLKILDIDSKLRENLNIPIEKFVISNNEKLTALTKEGWEIYFNLEGDIEWQITKLVAVLENKIPKEQRGDLEYIELRFGNFAPFKYRY